MPSLFPLREKISRCVRIKIEVVNMAHEIAAAVEAVVAGDVHLHEV
jgi:hypothetical protein